jgi:hypothetical protein
VLEDKFLSYDPIIARLIMKVARVLKAVGRFIVCRPQIPHLQSKVPQATSNSSSGMLTLSIHLNHLITWICTIFSVALAYTYIPSSTPKNFIIGLTIANGIISCASGFFISSYLIKKLEESLSNQILTIFFTSSDRLSTLEEISSNEPVHRPRQHIREKQSAITKVLVILIVIGLAFAICISTILNLLYKERLTALITFLLASMVDIVLLRPSIILIDSVLTFLGIRLTGSFRRKNKVSQRDEKSLLVGVEKNSDETNTPQDVSSSAALVREDYKSSNLKTANDSG